MSGSEKEVSPPTEQHDVDVPPVSDKAPALASASTVSQTAQTVPVRTVAKWPLYLMGVCVAFFGGFVAYKHGYIGGSQAQQSFKPATRVVVVDGDRLIKAGIMQAVATGKASAQDATQFAAFARQETQRFVEEEGVIIVHSGGVVAMPMGADVTEILAARLNVDLRYAETAVGGQAPAAVPAPVVKPAEALPAGEAPAGQLAVPNPPSQ